ncbi:MAG: DbpA RNA binding domain-containing protein [Gemmatimonadales bacterium]|nr:DbpA RNA binding domain-containing protein [Gemmatimonadales bacterium]
MSVQPDPLPSALRDAAATAQRGHNVIAVAPPGPGVAHALLGATLAARAPGAGLLVILVADAELAAWGPAVLEAARRAGRRALVAAGAARAARAVRDPALDVLVVTATLARALAERSAWPAERIAALLLVRPELQDEAVLTSLVADLPKEAQRVVLTSEGEAVVAFGERFARRALTVGVPAADTAPTPPAGPVRVTTVAWDQRAAALPQLLELLDPASAAVWVGDAATAGAVAARLPAGDGTLTITADDVPAAELVIAYDPPSVERLHQLVAAGPTIVLVPASAATYVARITSRRQAFRLPDGLDGARDQATRHRATIEAAVRGRRLEGALLALAPLLERHDAATVAAALYELWLERPAEAGAAPVAVAPAAPAIAPAGSSARVFVDVGRKDGLTPADLVAVLTKELGVDRGDIGRIEIRETFALVELPSGSAPDIAVRLSGKTVRRKRLSARLDRGGATRRREQHA